MFTAAHARRVLAAGAIAASAMALAIAAPMASAGSLPSMQVDKTVAHSGEDHGDSITITGTGCSEGNHVTAYLAQGVVANDQPLSTDIVGAAFSGVPDNVGNWEIGFSIQGGPGSALPSGQYTLRVGCYGPDTSTIDGELFRYAGVVITINGESAPTTTTTAGASTTTTTAPAAAPVSNEPAFTG